MSFSTLITSCLQLAKFTDISRHARNYGSTQQYVTILSVLGIGIVVWIVLYALGQLSKRKIKAAVPPSRPLIEQISEGLGLTAAEMNLLVRMASRNGLQPPEVLFIDPTLWKPCMESFPQERDKLIELMGRLFGEERREVYLS